jgi:hypothetical protein
MDRSLTRARGAVLVCLPEMIAGGDGVRKWRLAITVSCFLSFACAIRRMERLKL